MPYVMQVGNEVCLYVLHSSPFPLSHFHLSPASISMTCISSGTFLLFLFQTYLRPAAEKSLCVKSGCRWVTLLRGSAQGGVCHDASSCLLHWGIAGRSANVAGCESREKAQLFYSLVMIHHIQQSEAGGKEARAGIHKPALSICSARTQPSQADQTSARVPSSDIVFLLSGLN